MKRILIAGAFALAVGGPALAADLPQPMPPRAPATYVPTTVPYYNWGGIYFGVNGGYDYGRSNWSGAGVSTGTFNAPRFLVGGTLGANFQAGAFVFGVEGDLDYASLSGSATCVAGVTC
jgi:outer membrane immunogenic protein